MKAALITFNFETQDIKYTMFDDGPNPIRSCQNLWRAIKEDWPDYHHTIISDDEAARVNTTAFLKELGLED